MRTIQEMMAETVGRNASDLFITVGVPPVMKIGGELVPVGEAPLRPEDTEAMVRALLPHDDDLIAFSRMGEKDFSVSLPGIGRFRVNAFLQRGSMALSIRRIYTTLPDPDALGIPPVVMDLTRRTKGLVLVTGPTGCGKTTTLAAMIDRLNHQRSCHILTLEDPIEYLHSHGKSLVNQREIGTDSGNYASALRAALRQSPDVILIGEMRDLETIAIALTAAETGHLVLSTLHTIGAAKTIDRIIDVFPPSQQQQIRVQLSTVLQAVVSQQLVPAAEGDLRPAFEIMLVNGAIRNMIREGKTPQIDNVIQTGGPAGMTTMDMSLAELVRSGAVLRDEALIHCVSPDALARYLG